VRCAPSPKCPKNQFFANISRSMRSRGKIVEVENVPREISYKKNHSGISLGLPISLKIHSNKFCFFSRFWPLFANISQSMRPRGKIMRIKDVPREISYKVGHLKFSLHTYLQPKIPIIEIRKIESFAFSSRFRRLFCEYLATYEAWRKNCKNETCSSKNFL